jgi:hypothetical protein
MIRRVNKTISLLALSLASVGALAQDDVLEEEIPEVRRYTVEIIIFSYAQNVSAGSEIFVPDEPPPPELPLDGEFVDGTLPAEPIELVETIETIETSEEELEEGLEDEEDKYALVMLPEEDFVLLDIFERLDNLDAYTPLMHFGWTQPMYPQDETEVRPLSSFMTPPEGLEGELSMYLSRYLHLAVKLQLDAPVDENADIATPGASFEYDYGNFSDQPVVTYPVRYRIEEDRIFRNGELRYFDHPKIGVLAKITRAEEKIQDDQTLLEDEFLGESELLGE